MAYDMVSWRGEKRGDAPELKGMDFFAALAMTIRRTGSEVRETAWHYPGFGPDIQTNTGDAG